MSSEVLLTVRDVVKIFNRRRVLNDVRLELHAGEILGLVGPNGSGKTTLINVISGVYRPDSGEVVFDGRRIQGMAPHRVTHLGINRTFQVPRPFKLLSVRDNLRVAAVFGGKGGADVDAILERTGLAALADREARTLNTSQQKHLDLARALATRPRLLLVDEMGAGQNPQELKATAEQLLALRDAGIALLVVEHLLDFLNRIADRAIVLSAGANLFEGSLRDAAKDPRVVEAFIGA
ncbi:MAG TPA: ATP-binding cassette domain-containing protein [Nevskiaceae bacterium]